MNLFNLSILFEEFGNFRVFRVFNFRIRAKIKNSEASEIPSFSQIKEIHSNLEVLKKFPSFPSF